LATRGIVSFAATLAFAVSTAGAGSAAPAAHAATVCLDSSSPSFGVEQKIVAALARYGDALTPFVYDGSQGVSERFFKYLSRTKCALIMGFPVDRENPDPPDGLALTEPYFETAYVLVSPRKLEQRDLHAGMTVAVGMATAPHFYLAGAFGAAPGVTTDTYQTQEQVLDALSEGHAAAAMVWEPSLVRYAGSHPGARNWHVTALHIPHARWGVAALYVESRPAEAQRFNAALLGFERSGGLSSLTHVYSTGSQ
jgi:hypothetical protein